ncbi:unnamed protein product [Allacma fusca]|uniref:Uncharacterized protein n=1 Tax=Allacma fusca TaxID=39272 RepID=A0A8J2LC51_9HEXA|nr:unnamed protein product [Allacma fusca]
MRKFSVTFFHSKQVCQALTSPETVFLSVGAVQKIFKTFTELFLEIQQFWDNYTRNDLPCNLSMEHLKGFKNVRISTVSTTPANNSFSFNEYECGPPKVYGRE